MMMMKRELVVVMISIRAKLILFYPFFCNELGLEAPPNVIKFESMNWSSYHTCLPFSLFCN